MPHQSPGGAAVDLFKADQKIAHVTFPESGVASIVADTGKDDSRLAWWDRRVWWAYAHDDAPVATGLSKLRPIRMSGKKRPSQSCVRQPGLSGRPAAQFFSSRWNIGEGMQLVSLQMPPRGACGRSVATPDRPPLLYEAALRVSQSCSKGLGIGTTNRRQS